MAKSLLSAIALLFLLATPTVSECRAISFTACEPGGNVQRYDPDTGEICYILDCGGGRAPPKTDIPGCAAYKGTELPKTEKSYLPCWTGFSTPSSETTIAISTTTTVSSSPVAESTTTVVPFTPVTVPSSDGSGDGVTSSASISTTGTEAPNTTEPPVASTLPSSEGGAESTASSVVIPSGGNVVGGSGLLMAVVVGAAFGALL